MLKMISKFAASPFSGYALIALLVAAAGAGYWFWSELKEFGGLEQKTETQARDIRSLENKVSYLQGKADLKDEVNRQLGDNKAEIDMLYRSLETKIGEALKDAPQEYIDCRNMPVPERLRHPGGKATKSGDDQA